LDAVGVRAGAGEGAVEAVVELLVGDFARRAGRPLGAGVAGRAAAALGTDGADDAEQAPATVGVGRRAAGVGDGDVTSLFRAR
jgi:hypothetical protein